MSRISILYVKNANETVHQVAAAFNTTELLEASYAPLEAYLAERYPGAVVAADSRLTSAPTYYLREVAYHGA